MMLPNRTPPKSHAMRLKVKISPVAIAMASSTRRPPYVSNRSRESPPAGGLSAVARTLAFYSMTVLKTPLFRFEEFFKKAHCYLIVHEVHGLLLQLLAGHKIGIPAQLVDVLVEVLVFKHRSERIT